MNQEISGPTLWIIIAVAVIAVGVLGYFTLFHHRLHSAEEMKASMEKGQAAMRAHYQHMGAQTGQAAPTR